jgi:hypothetical protein
MMAALVAGERDPKILAQLARHAMRRKITVLEEAFTGYFTDHHAFLLGTMLARVDVISADIAAMDTRIEQMISPFADTVARLDEIPGISLTAAYVIIAETGLDMTRLPTAGHLVSRARFAPGVTESAGKKKGKGSTGHGNPAWPPSRATPPQQPDAPEPSPASATAASPAAAAPSGPSSRSATPSWSLPGICSPIPTLGSTISGRTTTRSASIPNDASATTYASSKYSDIPSPSSQPPEPHGQNPTAPLTLRRELPRAR